MTAPYAVRKIDVTIQLGTGQFGESGYDTITLSGFRVFVQIEAAVLPNPPGALIRIFGMSLDHINQLSRVGTQYQQRQNAVAVQAGDDISGMTTVYSGMAYIAYPDFTDQENASFVIQASGTPVIQLKPVPPISFRGSVNVETALTQIAKPAGLTVENSGVTTVLSNPYFAGTTMSQIMSLIRAADCFGFTDMIKKVVAIWPKNGSRNTPSTTVISPQTGMIGYPTFDRQAVIVRALFDPKITAPANNNPGMKIKIESQLKAAQGEWSVTHVAYNLASQFVNGPWEMVVTGNREISSVGG